MYPPKTQNYLMSVLFWGAGCGVPSSRRAMIFARLRSLLPDSSDPGDPKCNNRRHKYAVHAFLVKDERRILLRVFPDNRIHTCARGINCFTFAAKLSLHTRCPARPLLAKTRHRNGEFEQVHVTRGGYNLFADRTSAATMRANRQRLWLASMAYALHCALRRLALQRLSLGVIYAALGAFTFALNNVTMRRGWSRAACCKGWR